MYTCCVTFQDSNMSKIKQKESTKESAISTINHWAKQFSSIKILYFFDPEGNKICFDARGNYQFTIEKSSCETLNLKP